MTWGRWSLPWVVYLSLGDLPQDLRNQWDRATPGPQNLMEDEMSSCSKHHKELNERGEGKCSVPMWMGGVPAGFCDRVAYGNYINGEEFRDRDGRLRRLDGKYNGYVPHLACFRHGGPELKDVAHKGDPCEFCGIPHDDVKPGTCIERRDR